MDDRASRQAALYAQIIERFVVWASKRADIEGAFIVGSRARTDHPADEWSDLDLVIFATEPEAILDDESWLAHLGDPSITFREPTAVGIWEERRAMFANGCDADFSILPASLLDELHTMQPGDSLYDETAGVIRRGCRVILDSDGHLTATVARIAATENTSPSPPTQSELDQTLNDFWYHCVWTTKKLRRGELVVAHECLDCHMRGLLLRLVRWAAEVRGGIWHGTRFIEEWTPETVRENLAATWARHERDDLLRALETMMDLAAFLAREISAAYRLQLHAEVESGARQWVAEVSGRAPSDT